VNKSAEYKPFPGVVCERIRNIVKAREKAIAKRKELFQTRDVLRAEIFDLDKDDGGRAKKEAEAFRVMNSIEDLGITIKWYADQLAEAVEKADEPGLFEDAAPKPPKDLFVPKPPKHAEESEQDAAGDVPGQAELLVGGRENPFDQLAAGDRAPLKFPGRFLVTPKSSKKAPATVEAGDAENLEPKVLDVIGADAANVNVHTGEVRRDGSLLAVITQAPALREGEQVDRTTGKISKPKPGRKPGRKPARAGK